LRFSASPLRGGVLGRKKGQTTFSIVPAKREPQKTWSVPYCSPAAGKGGRYAVVLGLYAVGAGQMAGGGA
jgi:hypothetical protein